MLHYHSCLPIGPPKYSTCALYLATVIFSCPQPRSAVVNHYKPGPGRVIWLPPRLTRGRAGCLCFWLLCVGSHGHSRAWGLRAVAPTESLAEPRTLLRSKQRLRWSVCIHSTSGSAEKLLCPTTPRLTGPENPHCCPCTWMPRGICALASAPHVA